MSSPKKQVIHTIIRVLIVAVTGIAVGFLFNGSSVFVPTMVAFQFTLSSITAGLFYGFAKTSSPRSAIPAVFIWYVVSTLIDVHNSWLFILSLVYIAGISAAVYISILLVRRRVFDGALQRIAMMSLLTAIINAMVIFILVAISAASRSLDAHTVLASAWRNFQIGALIGLGVAGGIEIAEYILMVKSFREFIEGTQRG